MLQNEDAEIRRVQAYTGERSLTVVLAKSFANRLRIEKGDYLKCYVEGNRLILEKANV
jgi:hypothetical protein